MPHMMRERCWSFIVRLVPILAHSCTSGKAGQARSARTVVNVVIAAASSWSQLWLPGTYRPVSTLCSNSPRMRLSSTRAGRCAFTASSRSGNNASFVQ